MIKTLNTLPISGIVEQATIHRIGLSPTFDSIIPTLSAASMSNPASEKAIRNALDDMDGTLAFSSDGTGTNILVGYDSTGITERFKSLKTTGNDIHISYTSTSGIVLSGNRSATQSTCYIMKENGVAGGSNMYANTFPISSIPLSGSFLGNLIEGDMIGRVNVKCVESMSDYGQTYSVGTRATSLSSIAYNILPTSAVGMITDFTYGPLMASREFAYITSADVLVVSQQLGGGVPPNGKIAVNVMYDHAYWNQYDAYVLGDGDTNSIMKLELDTDTSSNRKCYMAAEASRYGSTSNGTQYIYAIDSENTSNIQRFDVDKDTTNMISRGAILSGVSYLRGQVQHSSTDLYSFCGRITSTSGVFDDTNIVQKLAFSNDTANAVVQANMTDSIESAQSWKSSSKAFIGGGQTWISGSITTATSGTSSVTYNERFDIESFNFSNSTVAMETAVLNTNKSNGATITNGTDTYIINGSIYQTSGYIATHPKMSTYDQTNDTVSEETNMPIYDAASQFATRNASTAFLFGGTSINNSYSVAMYNTTKMSLANSTFFISNQILSRDISNESGDII